MAARKKQSSKSASSTKDLLVFIVIVSFVAMITYFFTYNSIQSKIDQATVTTQTVDITPDY